MGITSFSVINLFPAKFGKFDDFIWKKANLKQCGNFPRVVGKQQTWQWIFPKHVCQDWPIFSKGGIGGNIDIDICIAAYHF